MLILGINDFRQLEYGPPHRIVKVLTVWDSINTKKARSNRGL